MKIGIVTLYDNNNFGNRLQNYAVQKYFEGKGFQTETFKHKDRPSTLKLICHWIAVPIHFLLRSTEYEKIRLKKIYSRAGREQTIAGFTSQYIKCGPYIRNYRFPKCIREKYDFSVSGGDQVWHCWSGRRRELKFYFLSFADQRKRITIAPSFGFDKFPKKNLKTYKRGLSGFEHLSVREERGAELINELTGKEATVLLDPTMLVDTSEWQKILRKPSQYADENYILVYALDGFKGDVKNKTCSLAVDLSLQVIDIMDTDSDYYMHTRPDEFLYWIQHARLVVTDSFHACVFSILFSRPFVVIDRAEHKGMESRLDTLFHKLKIADRHIDELKEGFEITGEVRDRLLATDYDTVAGILEKERTKADNFYRVCFADKEGSSI